MCVIGKKLPLDLFNEQRRVWAIEVQSRRRDAMMLNPAPLSFLPRRIGGHCHHHRIGHLPIVGVVGQHNHRSRFVGGTRTVIRLDLVQVPGSSPGGGPAPVETVSSRRANARRSLSISWKVGCSLLTNSTTRTGRRLNVYTLRTTCRNSRNSMSAALVSGRNTAGRMSGIARLICANGSRCQ